MTRLAPRRERDWRLREVLAALLAGAALASGSGASAGPAVPPAEAFEDEIRVFEAAEASSPSAPGGIVFTGSSSIRMWKTLSRDMAPLPVRNRGFGGSHIEHVHHFAGRTLWPVRPRAVVLYAGDNDLSAGTGKDPDRVVRDFEAFIADLHATIPDARLYFLAIKPSLSRWQRWPAMARANREIRKRCESDELCTYLDVATPMLGDDDRPRPGLFVEDGLHLSAEGYALWTEIVGRRLRRDWEAGLGALPR